jgi:lipid-binding SYLF domain-containing protein
MAQAKAVVIFSSIRAGVVYGFGYGEGVLLVRLMDRTWYAMQSAWISNNEAQLTFF